MAQIVKHKLNLWNHFFTFGSEAVMEACIGCSMIKFSSFFFPLYFAYFVNFRRPH